MWSVASQRRFQYNISWQWLTLSEKACAQASKYVDAHRTQKCVRLARTIYIRCIYGIFGREITNYTVLYGAYIRYTVLANPRNVRMVMANPFREGTCSGKQIRRCTLYTKSVYSNG